MGKIYFDYNEMRESGGYIGRCTSMASRHLINSRRYHNYITITYLKRKINLGIVVPIYILIIAGPYYMVSWLLTYCPYGHTHTQRDMYTHKMKAC